MLDPKIRQRLSRISRDYDEDDFVCAPEDGVMRGLDEVIPGQEHVFEGGKLFVCRRQVEHFRPEEEEQIASCIEELHHRDCKPEKVLFVDIETCGLWNNPIFLIGVMALKGGQVWVEQYFARDYSEEAALLAYFAERALGYGLLVTFNGKSFDLPYIMDRMILHRLGQTFRQEHLDLLIPARKKYRGTLPNCRLQTLEQYVCGRRRFGDTPGALIPELYHAFVRTGNAAPLDGIFHHNALDLITMAELLPHLGEPRVESAE
jgi:uncharacterized protein YprB with RNaseH-like and TPR domain